MMRNNDEHSTVTRRAATKPRATPAHCPTCREQARVLHQRTHLSAEAQAQIRKTERDYEALEVEFQQERQAELAARARGIRPVPGQWKLDQQRLAAYPAPASHFVPRTIPLEAAILAAALDVQPLVIYRDLWHQEAAS